MVTYHCSALFYRSGYSLFTVSVPPITKPDHNNYMAFSWDISMIFLGWKAYMHMCCLDEGYQSALSRVLPSLLFNSPTASNWSHLLDNKQDLVLDTYDIREPWSIYLQIDNHLISLLKLSATLFLRHIIWLVSRFMDRDRPTCVYVSTIVTAW